MKMYAARNKTQRMCVRVVSVMVVLMGSALLYSMSEAPDSVEDETAPQQNASTERSSSASLTPPAPQSAGAISEEDDIGFGPSTVDLPEEKVGSHGNWVKKNMWLNNAIKVVQDIETAAASTQAARKIINEKYAAIDDSLDNFYKSIGLEQGKLQDLFASLDKFLEKKKQSRLEELKEEEAEGRAFQLKAEETEERIKQYKISLEQLRLDMQAVEDLDGSLTARLKKADEQITVANQEAAAAREDFELMWDVIDDKIARSMYFEMKNGRLERVNAANSYLQSDLAGDFDNIAGTIQIHINKIKEAIKGLEEKGIIIQDRRHRLEEVKQLKLREELEKRESEQKKVRKRAIEKSFLMRFWDGVKAVVGAVIDAICKPFKAIWHYFFPAKQVPTVEVVQPVDAAQLAPGVLVPAVAAQQAPPGGAVSPVPAQHAPIAIPSAQQPALSTMPGVLDLKRAQEQKSLAL